MEREKTYCLREFEPKSSHRSVTVQAAALYYIEPPGIEILWKINVQFSKNRYKKIPRETEFESDIILVNIVKNTSIRNM